jgi:hypothetical protein
MAQCLIGAIAAGSGTPAVRRPERRGPGVAQRALPNGGPAMPSIAQTSPVSVTT